MKYYTLIFILIALHLVMLKNLQFTAWPEMFSYPYLLKNGFKLYQDIGLPYQPLLPLILENVYKLFGYNLLTLKLFTWSIILINDVLLFFISIKLTGNKYFSAVPVAVYVLLQPFTEGNMLWFDLATTPFILMGVLSLFYFKNFRKYLLLGTFFSLAFFIKQQTGIIILLLISYLLLQRKLKEIFYIFSGSAIPAIFVLFYILINGTLTDYIFWTIEVPLVWYPKHPGYTNLPSIKETAVTILLFAPVVLVLLKKLKKTDAIRVTFFLFVGAFIAAFPRFEFFRFQPALVLYIVLLTNVLPTLKVKTKILLYLFLILTFGILLKSNLHLFNLPARFYGDKEYKITEDLNKFIRTGETIYMLNEHSLFYVLTETTPPKPWIDNYVWYMEIEGMQDRVIRGLVRNPPRLIFRKKPGKGNWYSLGTYEPKHIVNYVEENYQKVDNIGSDIEVWKKN